MAGAKGITRMQVEGKHLEPEVQKSTVAIMREIAAMPVLTPQERRDINIIRERYSHYLDLCEQYNIPIGNMGAYAAIGWTKQEVHRIVNGSDYPQEVCDFIKNIRSSMSMVREIAMAEGAVHPAVGIFWQKNHDGFTDAQEITVTGRTEEVPVDEETLKEKYRTAISDPSTIIDTDFETV